MSVSNPRTKIDGFSKRFLSSLKILFDILDERKTGYIDFSEIEGRWQDSGAEFLPSGVIDALRTLQTDNGKLTFDNLVSGFKIAVSKNKVNGSTLSTSDSTAASTKEKDFSPLNLSSQTTSAFYPVRTKQSPSSLFHQQNNSKRNADLPNERNVRPELNGKAGKFDIAGGNVQPLSGKRQNYAFESARSIPSGASYTREYHGDFFRPKEKWDRKPGDGRSSVATSSALEFMSKASQSVSVS